MTQNDHLPTLLDAQRAAFVRNIPDYRQRMQALAALRDGLRACQADLLQAVSVDFGGRAHEETLLLELFPLFDQIRHARRYLKTWMRRRRVGSAWFLLPSRAYVQYQPLGVVGVIGAWNYPLLLSLGPLIDALAAGNHVLLKPSEVAPRTAEAIAALIAERFPATYVGCVRGDAETGAAFAALPFDHLFFTGSTRVGRQVLQAAAANLTPVTLELGGKSPAILHDSYPLGLAVERIMTAKLLNAGQTCVAPDYVLLPAGREGAFEREARRVVSAMYPCLHGNPDYTRIITARHLARLHELVRDAQEKGARIVSLSPANESYASADKLMPPMLVFDVNETMLLMQEEIFGPILPVVTHYSLDAALAFIHARPRPLALYYFDEDQRRINQVLTQTMSGGVAINDCLYHLGQHNLPFGGVGPSGMGHYHGFDGFVNFSKKRGVMVQRRLAMTALFRPPYRGRTKGLIGLLRQFVLRLPK